MQLKLTFADVDIFAQEIAASLDARFLSRHLRLYGVPRGGVFAVYALLPYLPGATIVNKPEEANVIVDDLIDSGRTRGHYTSLFPDVPFYALYDKQLQETTGWVVFPWEQDRGADSSAQDIPVRLLQYIGEEPHRGGLLETPARFLKAWKHYTSGYGQQAKDVLKVFEDGAEKCDEMIIVKDIPIFSHCEHHMCPFYGVAHIGYIPDGKIVGLSKLVRVADIFMRRLQVQERLTNQIADALWDELKPTGVGVVINCAHTCMIGRGVAVQGSETVTSAMRGVFKEHSETRAEFMSLIKS